MHALILLNGELYLPAFHANRDRIGPWDLVICADGGAKHAHTLGVTPDILLGDFDSLNSKDRVGLNPKSTMTFPVDKDKTDGQIAVEEALKRGASKITLLSALGGRLDHTLGNIALLRLMTQAGCQGLATDGYQFVYYVRDHLDVPGHRGQVISVFPLTATAKGVTIAGVRWPLKGATLILGETLTISNQFQEHHASIQVDNGEVLVVVLGFSPNEKGH